MNFLEFKRNVEPLPYFETRELQLMLGSAFSPTMLVNVKNWVNKGYLVKLRRGLYCIAELKGQTDSMVFASKLYAPSYVSLEMALGWYGIIPEAVFTVTSVSTRKTKTFKTPMGNFTFQKIKLEAFGGFETKRFGAIAYHVAVPEKALVDFFYLNRNVLDGTGEQFESYRFNTDFSYNRKKLLTFANAFQNKKVLFLTNAFIQYYVAR